MEKIRLDLAGKIYTAGLADDPIYYESGLRSKGRYFQLYETNGNVFGNISVFVGKGVETGWNATNGWKGQVTDEFLKNLILTITPHIHFPITKEHLHDLYKQGRYFAVYLRFEKDAYEKANEILYLNSGATPAALVHRLVFQDDITDERIRHEILRLLYDQWNVDYEQPLYTPIIANKMFLFGNELLKNIDYLVGEGFVDWLNPTQGKTNRTLKISREGIKYFDQNIIRVYRGNSITFMTNNINVAGGNIQSINNEGDGNTNIINSGQQTIESSFQELREAIQTEYSGNDKDEKLQQLATIEREAKESKDKKGVIAKLMDFAKDFALHHTITTIIFTKIIPVLQEAAKHVKL